MELEGIKRAQSGRTDWLAVAVIVAAPVDIVDLAGGTLGFRLTPFLILSATYSLRLVTRFLVHGIRAGTYRGIFRNHRPLFVLLILVSLSVVFVAQDPLNLSIKRWLLFAWFVCFQLVFLYSIRDQFLSWLRKAVMVFVVLQAIAVSWQLAINLGLLPLPEMVSAYFNLGYRNILELLRFGGLVGDPNRASVTLVLFLAFFVLPSAKGQRVQLPWWVVVLAVSEILLTLSRTGLAALLIVVSIVLLRQLRNAQFARVFGYAIGSLCLLWVGSTFLDIATLIVDRVTAVVELAEAKRASSVWVHFELIRHGFSLVLEAPRTLLVGLGWGTEYVYTASFFPDNKYGNFHSGYVSIAVQSGLVASATMVYYMVRPIFHSWRWRWVPLVFLWINVFYQFSAEPLFWLLLAAQNTFRRQT